MTRTASSVFYTLSLHDALPILGDDHQRAVFLLGQRAEHFEDLRADLRVEVRCRFVGEENRRAAGERACEDRKSTRLNSSHGYISYAVFCLKKKTRPMRT